MTKPETFSSVWDAIADTSRASALDGDKLLANSQRVIDVTMFLVGRHAASILGELGTEVIKVDYTIAGDPMWRSGTRSKRHDAMLASFRKSRNCKSVTLGLRQRLHPHLFMAVLHGV